MVLEVEWDDAKSERCRRERGFSSPVWFRPLPIPAAGSRLTTGGPRCATACAVVSAGGCS
jgi:hypothetical protein